LIVDSGHLEWSGWSRMVLQFFMLPTIFSNYSDKRFRNNRWLTELESFETGESNDSGTDYWTGKCGRKIKWLKVCPSLFTRTEEDECHEQGNRSSSES
jgi:hypothetical protein